MTRPPRKPSGGPISHPAQESASQSSRKSPSESAPRPTLSAAHSSAGSSGRPRADSRSARDTAPWLAVVPALCLAVLTLAAGTWSGAATAWGAATGHLAVLSLAALGVRQAADPLRLGRAGRWLPAALLVAVIAATVASPVGRAGWTVVLLAPAWLLVPAGIARLWRRAPRLGVASVSAVVLATSAVALCGVVVVGDPRASAPLGHHNFLAVWLLILLPLAVLPWWWGGVYRPWAAAAGGLGLAALLGTRSLSGAVALGGMAGLVLVVPRLLRSGQPEASVRQASRGWIGRLSVLLLLWVPFGLLLPRLGRVLQGLDLSVAARRTYWQAGWEGFLAHPVLGWGPGSTPWTLPLWLEPVPGVNPPYEVVGDLHSLPLALAYELGGTGVILVLAIAVLFVLRHGRRQRSEAVGAGLLGLAGAALATLTIAPLSLPAVVMAMAVAVAAVVDRTGTTADAKAVVTPRWLARTVFVGLVGVAGILGRLDLAHFQDDQAWAVQADPDRASRHLEAAVRLDPLFPLYRASLAALETGESDRSARRAREAARGAMAVPSLWLLAGDRGLAAGEPWAADALARACRFDALSPMAPFQIAIALEQAGEFDRAASALTQSLLAEPRLGASTWVAEHPDLLSAARTEIGTWPGLDAGWRRALELGVAESAEMASDAASVGAADDVSRTGTRAGPADVRPLRLMTGPTPTGSLARHAFRRSPRRLLLTSVPLDVSRLAPLAIPAASTLEQTAPAAFGDRGCGLPEPGGEEKKINR